MGISQKFLAKKLVKIQGCVPQRGEESTPNEYAAQKAARKKALEERRGKSGKVKKSSTGSYVKRKGK